MDGERVVGHVLFSPVTVERGPGGMGVGPLAMLPGCQRPGLGTALMEPGIQVLRDRGCPFILVYGHPGYYPRFGFTRASAHGLTSPLADVPDDIFMVLVLDPEAMEGVRGVVRHRRVFVEALET